MQAHFGQEAWGSDAIGVVGGFVGIGESPSMGGQTSEGHTASIYGVRVYRRHQYDSIYAILEAYEGW